MVAPSNPCSAKTSPAALRILSRVFSSLTSGAAPRFSRTIMPQHLNWCLKQSSEIFVLHDCFNFAHALGNCTEIFGTQIPSNLVVIDEASQVPPEEALGVLARGRQMVIVGDDKQLSPTNFFRMVSADDEEEGEQTDLVQSLNLGPIWQASDSLSPRAPGSARRPFLKFAPEPRRQDYQLPAHRKGL